MLARGGYSSEFSIHEFRKLLVSVIAYQQDIDLETAERRINQGDLELPASLRMGLFNRHERFEFQSSNLFTRLTDGVRMIINGRWHNADQNIDPELVDLVKYLENQLEIEENHGNHEGR